MPVHASHCCQCSCRIWSKPPRRAAFRLRYSERGMLASKTLRTHVASLTVIPVPVRSLPSLPTCDVSPVGGIEGAPALPPRYPNFDGRKPAEFVSFRGSDQCHDKGGGGNRIYPQQNRVDLLGRSSSQKCPPCRLVGFAFVVNEGSTVLECIVRPHYERRGLSLPTLFSQQIDHR